MRATESSNGQLPPKGLARDTGTPGWPLACYVAEGDLKLLIPLPLGLRVHTTTPVLANTGPLTESGSTLLSPQAGGGAGTQARSRRLALEGWEPQEGWGGPEFPLPGCRPDHQSLQNQHPRKPPQQHHLLSLHCCPLHPLHGVAWEQGLEWSQERSQSLRPLPPLLPPQVLLPPHSWWWSDLIRASAALHAGPCRSKQSGLERAELRPLSVKLQTTLRPWKS